MKIFMFILTITAKDVLKCNLDILNGYLLIGKKEATTDNNVVCPDIE